VIGNVPPLSLRERTAIEFDEEKLEERRTRRRVRRTFLTIATVIAISIVVLVIPSIVNAVAMAIARTFTGNNADWQALYPEGFQHDFEDDVTMVLVPAGSFTIGSKPQRADERNGNLIRFDTSFWIDLTEVTQADFERLGGTQARVSSYNGNQRPVEQITWFEARDFCALRGARLPTEAEWEYAARGPAEWDYTWGYIWIASNAVWNRTIEQGTANVGSIPAGRSWVGALDMSGNVWEWVKTIVGVDTNGNNSLDNGERFFSYPYDATDGREDNSDNSLFGRGQRGGSWFDTDTPFLRAGKRAWTNPDGAGGNSGFRCARSS